MTKEQTIQVFWMQISQNRNVLNRLHTSQDNG